MEKGKILGVVNRVYDPDYIDRSVVDMGLVTEDDILITDNGIEVAYSLTAPICPFSAAIGLMIKYAAGKEAGSISGGEAQGGTPPGGGGS
jgi:metal-sulfur cluster biosynthetic enzyme